MQCTTKNALSQHARCQVEWKGSSASVLVTVPQCCLLLPLIYTPPPSFHPPTWCLASSCLRQPRAELGPKAPPVQLQGSGHRGAARPCCFCSSGTGSSWCQWLLPTSASGHPLCPGLCLLGHGALHDLCLGHPGGTCCSLGAAGSWGHVWCWTRYPGPSRAPSWGVELRLHQSMGSCHGRSGGDSDAMHQC